MAGSLLDEYPDHVPDVVALGRVEARGGLVQVDDRSACDHGRAAVQPATHVAGVGLRQAAGGLGEIELLEQPPGAHLGLGGRPVEQLADHDQVLHAREVFINACELPGETDLAAHRLGLVNDIQPRDGCGAAIRSQQRRENAHCRGFADAIRAEDAENATLLDAQVNSVQGFGLAEVLDEAVCLDCSSHGSPLRLRSS